MRAGCSNSTDEDIDTAVHARMRDGRIDANGFDAIFIIYNGASCRQNTPGAYCYVQQLVPGYLPECHGFTGSNDRMTSPPDWSSGISHELGHAFGLHHAHGPIDDYDYGNPYDVMGMDLNNNANHMSVFHKWQLGWLGLGTDIVDVKDSNATGVTLNAISARSGFRGIRIPMQKDQFGKTTDALYVENRQPGVDGDRIDNFANATTWDNHLDPGVQVNRVRNPGTGYESIGLVQATQDLLFPVTLNQQETYNFNYQVPDATDASGFGPNSVCIRVDTAGSPAGVRVQNDCVDKSPKSKPYLTTSLGQFDKDMNYIGVKDNKTDTRFEPSNINSIRDMCFNGNNLYVRDSSRITRYYFADAAAQPITRSLEYRPNYTRAASVISGKDPNEYYKRATDMKSGIMSMFSYEQYKSGYSLPVAEKSGLLMISGRIACDPDGKRVFATDHISPSANDVPYPTTNSTGGRILVYDTSADTVTIKNGQDAVAVLGQDAITYDNSKLPANLPPYGKYAYKFFKRPAPPRGAGTFGNSSGIFYARSQKYLLVQDLNRILVFDLSGGVKNGMDAKYVIGQPDFTTPSSVSNNVSNYGGIGSIAIDENNKRFFMCAGTGRTGAATRIYAFDMTKLSNGVAPTYTTQPLDPNAMSPCEISFDPLHGGRLLVDRGKKLTIFDAGPDKFKPGATEYSYTFDLPGGTNVGKSKYEPMTGTLWRSESGTVNGHSKERRILVYAVPENNYQKPELLSSVSQELK